MCCPCDDRTLIQITVQSQLDTCVISPHLQNIVRSHAELPETCCRPSKDSTFEANPFPRLMWLWHLGTTAPNDLLPVNERDRILNLKRLHKFKLPATETWSLTRSDAEPLGEFRAVIRRCPASCAGDNTYHTHVMCDGLSMMRKINT